MHLVLIIFVLTLITAASVAIIYNNLTGLRRQVMRKWSDVDTGLKRRADITLQLIASVKDYAPHEVKIYDDAKRRRVNALAADRNPAKRGAAETSLSASISQLLAAGQDYPDVKASASFPDLQAQLAQAEEQIEQARRLYNGAVRDLNAKVKEAPSNLVAGPFGFTPQAYFEMAASDAAFPFFDVSP